jgi:hypothetical protein
MVFLFDLSSTPLFHGWELIGWDLIRKDMRKVMRKVIAIYIASFVEGEEEEEEKEPTL